MSRRTARVHALNLIFQFPFHPEWDEHLLFEATKQYLDDLPDMTDLDVDVDVSFDLAPKDSDKVFIEEEATGVFANLPQIDVSIDKWLKDWELKRIAKIDLALLRLATYEICFRPDITPATAINEAVELAKIYGTDDSPAFINGLLGSVAGRE